MFRRPHVLAFVFGATTTLVLTVAGCSDPQPATPRGIVDSTIAPGSNSAAECPESGPWLELGDYGAPPDQKPRPVDDGATDQGGAASITCSVVPSAAGFDVNATATLSGASGGSVTVKGFFNATGDSPNIYMSLSKSGRTGAYGASDCTARFTTPYQGVAAGRLWAEITCEKANAPAEQRTCRSRAQVRFENCGQ